jgi:hypothetical protein
MTVLLELIPRIPDYGLTNRAPLSGLFMFTPRMFTHRPLRFPGCDYWSVEANRFDVTSADSMI